MNDVLILNRPYLNRMPYRAWLGDDVDIRVVTSELALRDFDPSGLDVITVDDYDESGLVDWTVVREFERRPFDRLIALSENDLLRAGALRDVLGVSGQTLAGATAFRDKVVQKQLLRAAGVPVTNFAALDQVSDLVGFLRDHPLPVVVKPRSGTGSRSVSVLRTPEEVAAWLVKEWRLGLIGRSTWMVESFVDGEMINVDGVWNGDDFDEVWPSSVTPMLDYRQYRPTYCVLLDRDDPVVPGCRDLVHATMRALSAREVTVLHAELWRTSSGELLVNEIASRMGGGAIRHTHEAAFGVHLNGRAVRATLDPGYLTREPAPVEPIRQVGFVLVAPRPGRVTAVGDVAPWLGRDDVLDALVEVELGQDLDRAASSTAASAWCLMTGSHHDGVVRRLADFVAWADRSIRYDVSSA